MRIRIFLVLFIISFSVPGQIVKSFIKLSLPEKFWVLTHPFVAKKSFLITLKARDLTDSIKLTKTFKDSLIQGGQLDAFRHSCWMALLSNEIGKRKSLKLGKAHENGNYRGWKKGKMEIGVRADSLSCEMDLFNNIQGAEIGLRHPKPDIPKEIILAVKSGRMKVLLLNEKQQRLDCENRIVNLVEYVKAWNVPGCLVSSEN